ncbi:MAG: hypothetical protein ACI3YC_08375 [Alloprevotella sp.]
MLRHLFLHELLSNWRSALLACGGMFVAFGVALLFGWMLSLGQSGLLGALLSFLLSGLFFVYSLSQTFSCLRTKQGRISFFMLPASVGSKFGVRVALHTLGAAVAIFVSFALAERVLVLLFDCFGFSVVSPWESLVEMFKGYFQLPVSNGHVNALAVVSQVSTLANFFFVCCANLLGSVCFRKHAFIHTQLVLFLLFVGYAFLLGFSIGLTESVRTVTEETAVAFASFSIFIELLISLGCLWLCWKWFGRLQVIPRTHLKFFSL